jgi:hypothetical protein
MQSDSGRPKPTDSAVDQSKRTKQPSAARRAMKRFADAVYAAPPRRSTDPRGQFVPLVEEDSLFVCIVRNKSRDASGSSAADSGSLLAAAAAFREAFTWVWHRIPWQDRQLIQWDWNNQQPAMSSEECGLPLYCPLIKILDVGLSRNPLPELESGHELRFPLLFIRERPEELPLAIAKLLAQTKVSLSDEYSQLENKWSGERLPKWQDVKEGKFKMEEYEAKASEREAEFSRRLEVMIVKVLRGWGFLQEKRKS